MGIKKTIDEMFEAKKKMKALVRYGTNKLEPDTWRKVLYHSEDEELLHSEAERLNKKYPDLDFKVEDDEIDEASDWFVYDVFLHGKEIDTLFFSTEQDLEDLKRSLVNHDGYDPEIEVKLYKGKKKHSK